MGDFSKSSNRKYGKRKSMSKSLYSMESEIRFSDEPTYINAPVYKEDLEGLNEEQSKMVTDISNYISGPSDLPFFMVQGSGGTGKSFSIYRAIKNISPDSIIAAAPSHFAKNVLQNFLGDLYTVTTIAALLGKKVTYNKKGEEILVPIPGKKPPILSYPIIILDEGSMVDDETYEEILDYVTLNKKKLVILGDYCQLPPVNQEHDSLFFQHISAELVQPMRFTGPIYSLANHVRQEIVNIREDLVPRLNILNIATDRHSFIDESGSGYIFLNNMRTLLKAAIRRFKAGKGPNYARVVAYRNKTIDKINHHIRVGLYGEHSKQFEKGELLINNGGYAVMAENSKGRLVRKALISNGSIFEVSNAVPVEGPYGIPCMRLSFKGKSFEYPILTVATEGKEKYNNIEERYRLLAKKDSTYWKQYYSFKESFAYFAYNYATSSHKVQGSSIKHVYVMEDDIYDVYMTSAKEKLQSLYVSITRAAYRVYVYHKKYSVDQSKLDKDKLKYDYDGEFGKISNESSG